MSSENRGREFLTGSRTQDRYVSSPTFLCPGDVQSVSRAIHLARLNAAWPVCDQCEYRHDTEGLAETTAESTDRIRDQRVVGIRRTEFGVRGQYINELNRRTASELARVFCFCLHQFATTADSSETPETRAPERAVAGIRLRSLPQEPVISDVTMEKVQLGPVVVGYDGRSSSPDIFVGVTAAVREFGLPIVDIGRCTAASIQEAARSLPSCSGAIFVTGAGSPGSWTGLDVSDAAGDPVPVIWKDFGIRLQHVSSQNPASDPASNRTPQSERGSHAEDDRLTELLERMRAGSNAAADVQSDSHSYLRLLLPDATDRGQWMSRLSRKSGEHQVVDSEPSYRLWLSRWFPENCALRVHVRSDDPVIQQRVAWLAERTQMELIARPLADSSSLPPCVMTMTIAEDDRHFSLSNRAGMEISPERLAGLMNVAIHSQASLVTVHSDAASGRFWLADASRAESTRLTERVRDSLASLGLISRLIHAGRLTLE